MESTINRYTRGGFLVGDIVKFKDGYDKMSSFKSLNDEIQRRIVMYANSDLPIRISNIKNHYPSNQPGNDDNMDGLVSCDISQEVMPGKFYEYVTCPADLLVRIDAYPNLTPVSVSHHYDNKENIKPIPVDEYQEDEQEIVINQTRKTSQNPEIGSATAPAQTNLLNTQVKIPHGSDTGKLADQGGTKSYTSIYMGLRR